MLFIDYVWTCYTKNRTEITEKLKSDNWTFFPFVGNSYLILKCVKRINGVVISCDLFFFFWLLLDFHLHLHLLYVQIFLKSFKKKQMVNICKLEVERVKMKINLLFWQLLHHYTRNLPVGVSNWLLLIGK